MRKRQIARLPKLFLGLLVAPTLLWLLFNATRMLSDTNSDRMGGTMSVRDEKPYIVQQILRCASLRSHYPDSIPPIVHWTTKDGRIPAKLVPLMQSWRKLINSSLTQWKFMHWDDNQLSWLISTHYPWMASSYAKLLNGLERSDIGRLVVLHHVGGVYVDTDVELRRDLTPLLRPPLVGFARSSLNPIGSGSAHRCCDAILSQEPPEHAAFLYDMEGLTSNAVMLFKANHSFLTHLLHTWPVWFESNWAGKRSRSFADSVYSTGPVMLHQFYINYTTRFQANWSDIALAEPEIFQPIWDTVWMPQRVSEACSGANNTLLSDTKKRHCQRLLYNMPQPGSIPTSSFTVHRFSHLNYSNKVDFSASTPRIHELLPILKCAV